ncbi:MAG TPA: hypothetical protein VKK79_23465 [Candidatus Lokiarchaeia archaeon]|nr:hypothetical protein [Candidatus Lokiarchaeia archaeon]
MADNRYSFLIPIIPLGLIIALLAVESGSTWLAVGIWLIVVFAFLLLAMLFSWRVTTLPSGFLIDERNKVSLARVQASIWVGLLLSAYITATLWNAVNQFANPLDVGVDSYLWILLGISLTALIASPFIKGNKEWTRRSDQIHTLDTPKDAKFSDILRGEEEGNFYTLDIAKVQFFFFTIILAFAYTVELIQSYTLATVNAVKINQLPVFDSDMILLLGISATAYLISKGIPRPANDNATLLAKVNGLISRANNYVKLAEKKEQDPQTAYERYIDAIESYDDAFVLFSDYLAQISKEIPAKASELKESIDKDKQEITGQYEADPTATLTTHTMAIFRGMIERYRNLMYDLKKQMY